MGLIWQREVKVGQKYKNSLYCKSNYVTWLAERARTSVDQNASESTGDSQKTIDPTNQDTRVKITIQTNFDDSELIVVTLI